MQFSCPTRFPDNSIKLAIVYIAAADCYTKSGNALHVQHKQRTTTTDTGGAENPLDNVLNYRILNS